MVVFDVWNNSFTKYCIVANIFVPLRNKGPQESDELRQHIQKGNDFKRKTKHRTKRTLKL